MKSLVFRKELMEKVLNGSKTQTRRKATSTKDGEGYVKRYKVGDVCKLTANRFWKDNCCGYVEITGVRQERLGNMTASDARKEGFDSFAGFYETWLNIHEVWNPSMIVTVIDFKVVVL